MHKNDARSSELISATLTNQIILLKYKALQEGCPTSSAPWGTVDKHKIIISLEMKYNCLSPWESPCFDVKSEGGVTGISKENLPRSRMQ